jgi:hypothetical protein
MASDSRTFFIEAAKALAPRIAVSAEEGERMRRRSSPVVEATAQAGLCRFRRRG